LEADESINAVTCVHGNREVTIWESNTFEYPDQQEEDEIARNRIIRERLNPAADWFFCHENGKRIETGTVLEHRSRVLIGLRDVVDPDWWHRAMSEMTKKEDSDLPRTHEEEKVPESAQPALCLPSSRIDQHEGKAQVDSGMETSEEKSNARGKSGDSTIVVKDCTVAVDFQHQLSVLRRAIPNTLQAMITFQRQSVQMFFSPENAIADFKRKVKELWNIPTKMFYLLVNGVHESLVNPWNSVSSVLVKIRGLGAGQHEFMKIHLKVEQGRKAYEIRVRDDITFEDIITLVGDIFADRDDIQLYQDGSLLSVADSAREWLTNTGGGRKSRFTQTPPLALRTRSKRFP
jgi:hypothetical protein